MLLLGLPCGIKVYMSIQIYNNFIFLKKYQKYLETSLERIEHFSKISFSIFFSFINELRSC